MSEHELCRACSTAYDPDDVPTDYPFCHTCQPIDADGQVDTELLEDLAWIVSDVHLTDTSRQLRAFAEVINDRQPDVDVSSSSETCPVVDRAKASDKVLITEPDRTGCVGVPGTDIDELCTKLRAVERRLKQ